MTFELYIEYTFSMPLGSISSAGIEAIETYISHQNLSEAEWKALNPNNGKSLLPHLPSDWEWVWMTKAGKFPTRVRAYYHKQYGLKCPESFLMGVGNIAKAHAAVLSTYTFDFTNEFDWQDGDFGDDGSCFWGSNAGALEMLRENGGLAIRFYNADGEGIARAWLVEIENALYIVFNGYGFETLVIASVFAAFMGLSYKMIDLSNKWGATLYINGRRGFIIGDATKIATITQYDFDWEDVQIELCNYCGQQLDEHEIYWGADDMPYCNNCFYNEFSNCYHCGEAYWRDDVTYVPSVGDDVCNWCLKRDYQQCPRCLEYEHRHNVILIGLQEFCQKCAEELQIEGDNIE